MAKAIDKSNFGYLGGDFQYKLVKCFIEEPHFFAESSKIVDSTAFTDSHLREFVGLIKDYFDKENLVPSYTTLKTRLNAKATSDIQIKEWDEVIEKLKATTTEDWDFIKTNALKFFKQQALIKAANKMLDKAGSGEIDKFDECQKIIEDALMVGKSDDYGHSLYDLLEPATSEEYTISIPTGISELDKALGGGLDKGNLGLIICSLGVGKTTLSCALASAAAIDRNPLNNNEGWKVLQIYFEDKDVDIARKIIGKYTGVEAADIKRCDADTRQNILNIMNNHKDKELIKNNLKLLKKRTGEPSATDIKNDIIKFTNAGFKPDLVIIDYFECLSPERGGYQTDSEWSREGKTMRALENVANDLNVAIWLPTQGTKDSIGLDFLDVDKAGGTVKKGQVAQVILTVGKTVEQAQKNRATMFLGKNRGGRAKKIFRDVYFNNGTCEVRCDDVTTYDDNLTWKEENARMNEENRISMQRKASAISREKSGFE